MPRRCPAPLDTRLRGYDVMDAGMTTTKGLRLGMVGGRLTSVIGGASRRHL